MGRQKGEGARTKARPSSSRVAASLVPVSTAAVGFGGYVGSTRVDSVLGDESASFSGVDGEMAQYLRRLARKDSTTKGNEYDYKALKCVENRISNQINA